MTVGFISKLDQCSFKLGSPSYTTGMITLKEVVICLIVVSTSGYLSRNAILLLQVLGVKETVTLTMQSQIMYELNSMLEDRSKAIQLLP
jgi:hypothetical protein